MGFAKALDWGLGFSVHTPYFLKPIEETGDASINFNGEWVLHPRWSIRGKMEFAVEGLKEINLGAMARFYLTKNYTIRPFLQGGGLIQVDPYFDGGLQGGGGVCVAPFSRWERFSLEASWNYAQFFKDPQSSFVDIFRVGVMLYY